MHLEAKNLVKTYKRRNVVDHVSLRVNKGEIVGLLGPNGAGKTTTFYMITGLEQPSSGDVFVSDVCITAMPMHERARLGIGYLAQEASIFRKMTVEENLRAILEMTKLSAAEQEQKMEQLLAEFHVSHVRDRLGTELSGGEQQRVAVARALMNEPDVILADEPSGSLDSRNKAELHKLFFDLRDQLGQTFIIVTHDVELAATTDRTIHLKDGKIDD